MSGDRTVRRSVLGRLPTLVWLTLVWAGLWGTPTAGTLAAGVLLAAALLAGFPVITPRSRGRVRPLALLRLVAAVAVALVRATAEVTWQVLTPNSELHSAVLEVPVRGGSDRLLTLVGNVISLTPGSNTLEVDPEGSRLFVHVLHLADEAAVRAEILHFEALAIRAFGSPEALAALDSPRAGRAP